MSDEKLNRRDFFRRAAAIGASVAGAGMLLSACKDGGGGGAKGGDKSAGGEKAEKGGDKGGSGELTCTDTSSLTDAEKKTRESLKYVDKSPEADKNCKNCKLYTEPKEDGGCGGCTVVAGPIHPKGYCISWQAAA